MVKITRQRSDAALARHRERRFDVEVRRNLTRNFFAHLCHGMLGQTGFRLVNAPTFLPAYVLMLSGGSDIAVGIALALQSAGMMVTPFFGATLIEHRPKVLPVGMIIGTAMRLSVLGIALSGLLLPPELALLAIFFWLTLFGLFQGMQGVLFNFLMAKVIPVSKRGRLTGLRNFLAGITSAFVAYAGGQYFLGAEPDVTGYSYTFVLAFVLTMCGLLMLLAMKEPAPPVLRSKSTVRSRLKELPALLRDDSDFTRYFLARALASAGRMALPFYVLYAGTSMTLTGANLALTTIAFTIAGTVSNLLWGAVGDRFGFRAVFLSATGLWVVATLALMVAPGIVVTVAVFAAIGAAVQGFQNASMNLTLEFGRREDLPVRIAVANTASEFTGSLGPLAGGFLAASLGYEAVFSVSVAFLLAGGLMVFFTVREPRKRR